MIRKIRRVGAVVLTYNSNRDLPDSLTGLAAQREIDLRVIVVDNASTPASRTEMEAAFVARFSAGCICDSASVDLIELANSRAIFLRNKHNAGYSAGNNIGARLAVRLGCEAVLIVNPDVRIDDPHYIASLAEVLAKSPNAGIAASSMRSLSGANENPMQEPSLAEELLWPVDMLLAGLRLRRRAERGPPELSTQVEKVSGSCFLISAAALEAIGYFDEGVFLYCEESILAAQLKERGLTIAYASDLEALHAHDTGLKGDAHSRYAVWSKSRAYYHRRYTHHGAVMRALLSGSRSVTLGLIRGRAVVRQVIDRVICR